MNLAHAAAHHKKQSALGLTAIQVTGATSVPVLNSSVQLSHSYGVWNAFWILLFGNVIIWLVALVIINMTANTPKNTLDNTRDYLGKVGAYTIAIVLIVSTIAWFVLQINVATEIILQIVHLKESYQINRFLQVGVALGALSALCSMEGIDGLRWVALISFPLLIIAFLGVLGFSTHAPPVDLTVSSSIGALAIALGTSLSIAVDYPTFFQHSRSKRSSIVAVSAIQLITLLMGIGGLYLGKYIGSTKNISEWNLIFHGSLWVQSLFLVLVVLSCLCVNTVNVYSGSIAWELLAPDVLTGRKEYMILGLGLTSIFVLVTNLLPMYRFLAVTDVALSCLCLVLVFGYFGKLWVGKMPPLFDKVVYFCAWLIGAAVALAGGLHEDVNMPILLLGFGISIGVPCVMFTIRKWITPRAV